MSEKLDYHTLSGSGRAHWKNERGDIFEEFEIEFKRELSPQERTEVMRHFVLGFAARNAQHEYCVASLDFTNPSVLKLAIQLIAPNRTGALLALLVQLREMFPVARVGDRVYPDPESGSSGPRPA